MTSSIDWNAIYPPVTITTTPTNPIFTDGWKEYLDRAGRGNQRRGQPTKELLEYRKPGSVTEPSDDSGFSLDNSSSSCGNSSGLSDDCCSPPSTSAINRRDVQPMLVNGSPSQSFAQGRQQGWGGRTGSGHAVRRGNRKNKNRPNSRPFCEVCFEHELSQGAVPPHWHGGPSPSSSSFGDVPKPWNSHSLTDIHGRITCPLLYFNTCVCGATRDSAHLPRLCPMINYQRNRFGML